MDGSVEHGTINGHHVTFHYHGRAGTRIRWSWDATNGQHGECDDVGATSKELAIAEAIADATTKLAPEPLSHVEWVAEINRRLQAHPRFREGLHYSRIGTDGDGRPGATSWFDPLGDDRNRDMFLEISRQMCVDYPLIKS